MFFILKFSPQLSILISLSSEVLVPLSDYFRTDWFYLSAVSLSEINLFCLEANLNSQPFSDCHISHLFLISLLIHLQYFFLKILRLFMLWSPFRALVIGRYHCITRRVVSFNSFAILPMGRYFLYAVAPHVSIRCSITLETSRSPENEVPFFVAFPRFYST